VTHDEAQEMLAVLAAGAADEGEAAEALAHAESCELCRDVVGDYRDAAAALAFALEPVAPPAALRSRVLEAARLSPAEAPAVPDTSASGARAEPISIEQEREKWRGWERIYRYAVPAVAAAALVAVLLLAVENANLRGEDEVSRGEFVSDTGATGTFVHDEETDLVYVSFENMPEVQEGQVFQMWMLDDGAAIPAPTFSAAADGSAAVSFPAEVDFDALAVTVEPAGGSAQPTTPPFIQGS
jgi:anti-sigma-K factor RskA